MSTRRSIRQRLSDASGYSMIEMLVATGVFTGIMAATLGGLSNMTKANEIVLSTASVNAGLRSSMDMVVRDMLQAGSGLPGGHVITIPSGAGSGQVRLPGPPGTNFLTAVGDTTIPAIIPRPGAGPVVNGVATDVVTMLMADNNFLNVGLTAITATTVTVAAGPDIANGPDRVVTGQLMMVKKGSTTTLLQVTGVNTGTRVLTFANGDSLNLNQSGASAGTLAALNATAPANTPSATVITRIRMITYYLDATIDAAHPRLVRRINNGHPTTFNNNLGTAVAFDVEALQFTWDINNGTTNPGNVRMTAADLTTAGACSPDPCALTGIRKANISLTARNRNVRSRTSQPVRNALQSEVALRGMAFVDRYRSN